jgi:hypothetical protein
VSIFGYIMSKIFGHEGETQSGAPGAASPAAPASASSTGTVGPKAASTPSSTAASVSKPAAISTLDVSKVLDAMAAKHKEKYNWRVSISDLMRLLDLDNSLAARKELAKELHYSGDTNDSATMNIWLHKQVMQKLAENGGKVPEELKA